MPMAGDTKDENPAFEKALAEFQAALDDLAKCEFPPRPAGKGFFAELLGEWAKDNARRKGMH